MSVLAALARAYERLPDVAQPGFSAERISFVISLNDDGSPAGMPIDLRTHGGKKVLPRMMPVPQPPKKSVNIAPNFLWGNTAYTLQITGDVGKKPKRLADTHQAFVAYHNECLAHSDDPGLRALLAFLNWWTPEQFAALGWPAEMKDQNIVFALESDRLDRTFLHDREAAKALWARLSAEGDRNDAVCLVTGDMAPVARLHPAIKGVWGAQSSGASIVSFNLDAFESYGHTQGGNAPVSEAAAFAYTTALNHFLAAGSKNRIQIGDTSTVFWADASDAEVAELAEGSVAAMLGAEIDEGSQAERVGVVLKGIRAGRPLAELDPRLATGVRFYVLGLAPNAARLSIRYWFEDDFGVLARNYQRFMGDMRIEPPPPDPYPPLWHYLVEVAVLGKRENVPPNLAGDWLRAILTGTRYPLTLLATVLMRIRADHAVNGFRVSLLKSILIRNFNREVPVALDPDNKDKGYLLGRLFALYEYIQTAALGSKVNATIRDKFYGAASAQPRKVFPLLDRGSANHLSKVGKDSPGRKINLERQLGQLMEQMAPGSDPFPASLSAQEQALFGLGYYHQRNDFFKTRKDAVPGEDNK